MGISPSVTNKPGPGKPGGKRIPPLDGLRVLMIGIVSWYHIWQQSWLHPKIGSLSLDWLVRSGYIWVDGTILLSAFLLFLPWTRAARGEGPMPDTGEFYYRRTRRILPSYYFIIIVTFLSICLPWDLYRGNGPWMVKDLATHFSFTFPFFYDTYIATPLGAASWTLAIEMQAYLLFPLIARAMIRKPVAVAGAMLALCFGFRAWCLWALDDYGMVVNQLINFLDVYVIGIAGAAGYAALSARKEKMGRKGQAATAWGATALFIAAAAGMVLMLQHQAGSNGYPMIQGRQMIYRPAYALLFLGMVFGACFGIRPLRAVLGNRVTRFLSAISMNYYLTHQVIIVHMKRIHFPTSENETPNMAGEQPWQNQYTLAAFGISLAVAILITYGIEKPCGKLMDRIRSRKKPPVQAV